MKAVIVTELDTISVEEVELAPPAAGEVKVKMAAVGVCHSDLSNINGTIPCAFPFLLGHEGAGVVEEVGEGVSNVSPGDHVVLSFVPSCQECFFCLRGQQHLCEKANTLNMGRQLDGMDRGLGLQDVLAGLDDQQIDPTVEQSTGLIEIAGE